MTTPKQYLFLESTFRFARSYRTPLPAICRRLHHLTLSVCVSGHLQAVAALCRDRTVDLVVVGPEDPLAAGLVDSLIQARVPCFGPTAAGALIEADKAAAKRLMGELNIPTAEFEVFTDAESAKKFIRR